MTNDVNSSVHPFLSVSGSNVHVIWQDNRDANWEIYYKKNPTGNGIEEKFDREKKTEIYKNLFIDNLNFKSEKIVDIYDLNGRIEKFKSPKIYFLKNKGKIFKVIKLR